MVGFSGCKNKDKNNGFAAKTSRAKTAVLIQRLNFENSLKQSKYNLQVLIKFERYLGSRGGIYVLVGKGLGLPGSPGGLRSLDWPRARATAPGEPTWPNHRLLLPFYIRNNVGNNNVCYDRIRIGL